VNNLEGYYQSLAHNFSGTTGSRNGESSLVQFNLPRIELISLDTKAPDNISHPVISPADSQWVSFSLSLSLSLSLLQPLSPSISDFHSPSTLKGLRRHRKKSRIWRAALGVQSQPLELTPASSGQHKPWKHGEVYALLQAGLLLITTNCKKACSANTYHLQKFTGSQFFFIPHLVRRPLLESRL
jgi:hypothetical protein